MSFATFSLIAAPDTPEFILLTAALAVLAGLISILAGFLKLSRVAQFFSESVMVGFLTGLALTVIIKQVPKLLGIEGGHGNFWERLYEIIIHLPETHLATLVMGILCLVLLIALEHYFHKIPAALVVLVFGILISDVFGQVRRRHARSFSGMYSSSRRKAWQALIEDDRQLIQHSSEALMLNLVERG